MRRAVFVVAVVLALASLIGCSAAQQAQVTTAGVEVGQCILSVVVPDVLSGESWQQCVDDAVTKCGASAAQVVSIYAAHVHAEVIEGKMPTLPAGYDAGAP